MLTYADRYAAKHTPHADGILRTADAAAHAAAHAANTAAKQQARPWREPPVGFVDRQKGKTNGVPKFVDPDVTMKRWKKQWELKILNDPDLRVRGEDGEVSRILYARYTIVACSYYHIGRAYSTLDIQ